jgi:[acyl-carrier-protein] S-malonyltransferase
MMPNDTADLGARMSQAAFAFRGYNVTNLGRTPELLAHPAYGPIVEAYLREASEVGADLLKRPMDLVARVRAGRETAGLEDYAEDLALIIAAELAHLRILEECFGVSLSQARVAFGYSLGECAALMATGVFKMADLLRIPLAMADDCVELAKEVTLGVLFSRGPVLDFDMVRRLCLEITQKGQGIIDISTYLSPNSLLLMGQNGSVAHFEARIHDAFPKQVFLRRHNHRYPPLHTPIMWQRNIPNRTAVMLQTMPGGFQKPSVPLLSMVTGAASYQEFNSRELMHLWVDHPQRLWEIVYKVLSDGIETVVHVGPAPNLVPATFNRLANNLANQTQGRGLGQLGRRTLSRLVRRPWLTRLLPSSAVLFRGLFVENIILEDWLLEHAPTK